MTGDTNFEKIIDLLKGIHKDYPTLRFGEVIQKSIDLKKMRSNFDLHNCSSKELLNAIEDFKTKIDGGKL